MASDPCLRQEFRGAGAHGENREDRGIRFGLQLPRRGGGDNEEQRGDTHGNDRQPGVQWRCRSERIPSEPLTGRKEQNGVLTARLKPCARIAATGDSGFHHRAMSVSAELMRDGVGWPNGSIIRQKWRFPRNAREAPSSRSPLRRAEAARQDRRDRPGRTRR